MAATIPVQISEPSSSIEDVQLRVDWAEPFSGGQNVAIDFYTVQILTPTFEYIEICQTVNLFCLYPMQDLSSFGFLQGDSLRVKVAATNVLGQGPFSDLSTAVVA